MLEGIRVLVTRPRERAEQWIVALQQANAEVLYLPLFDLAPLKDPAEQQAALDIVDEVAQGGQPWLAFTSVPAVHHFVQLLGSTPSQAKGTDQLLGRFQIAVIGDATAEAVQELGLTVNWVATQPNAAALARDLIDNVPLPFELLHPTSDQGLKTLTEKVAEVGGRVERLVVYRQRPLDVDVSSLFRGDEPPHVLTFASPSAVTQFLRGATEKDMPQLQRLPAVAIGLTTAGALQEAGFDRVTVLPTPQAEALLIGVARAFGR